MFFTFNAALCNQGEPIKDFNNANQVCSSNGNCPSTHTCTNGVCCPNKRKDIFLHEAAANEQGELFIVLNKTESELHASLPNLRHHNNMYFAYKILWWA